MDKDKRIADLEARLQGEQNDYSTEKWEMITPFGVLTAIIILT